MKYNFSIQCAENIFYYVSFKFKALCYKPEGSRFETR
jgi:hypothetical protein